MKKSDFTKRILILFLCISNNYQLLQAILKRFFKTEFLSSYPSHYEIKRVPVKFVHAFFRAITRKVKSASCEPFII